MLFGRPARRRPSLSAPALSRQKALSRRVRRLGGTAVDPFNLTRQGSRRLEKQLKTTHDARVYERTLALLEIARGRPVSEVAEMLRMTRRAVYRWIAVYAESKDP